MFLLSILVNQTDVSRDEQVSLALRLRLVVAIANYERGDNPGSTIITVRD
jgi:hypothetical protein